MFAAERDVRAVTLAARSCENTESGLRRNNQSEGGEQSVVEVA